MAPFPPLPPPRIRYWNPKHIRVADPTLDPHDQLVQIRIFFQPHSYPANLLKKFTFQLSFCGATGTPVLDFWWHLLWVSKPEWVLPYSIFCGGECNVHSPRFTSGATLAALLVAGTQPVTSSHACAEVGFERAIIRFVEKVFFSWIYMIDCTKSIRLIDQYWFLLYLL